MTRRLPIAWILLVMAALAGALAGCQQDRSAAAPSAAGAPSSGGAEGSSAAGPPTATSARAAATSDTECPEAAGGTYVQAVSGREQGDTVVVTAHPARRVCGGPNNSHFELEGGTEQLTLTSSATVVLLTTTPSGLGHETVAATELPERLVDDRFGRIFLVHGPLTAVTSLVEQYHP